MMLRDCNHGPTVIMDPQRNARGRHVANPGVVCVLVAKLDQSDSTQSNVLVTAFFHCA